MVEVSATERWRSQRLGSAMSSMGTTQRQKSEADGGLELVGSSVMSSSMYHCHHGPQHLKPGEDAALIRSEEPNARISKTLLGLSLKVGCLSRFVVNDTKGQRSRPTPMVTIRYI